MKNERGFVAISLILVLPFLLIFCFSSLWSLWFINKKNRIEKICFSQLMKAQNHLIKGNQGVLSLNFYANSLIIRKKQLAIIIATAPPQAKIVAEIERRFIIAQQVTLAAEQKLIFRGAEVLALKELIILREKYDLQLADWKKFWKAKAIMPNDLRFHPPKSKLIIEKRDIASTYKRASRHSIQQRLSANWTTPVRRSLPKWIQSLVPVPNLWHGECHVHPHGGYGRWISKIGKGNHF